jgi:hypothetical protein
MLRDALREVGVPDGEATAVTDAIWADGLGKFVERRLQHSSSLPLWTKSAARSRVYRGLRPLAPVGEASHVVVGPIPLLVLLCPVVV